MTWASHDMRVVELGEGHPPCSGRLASRLYVALNYPRRAVPGRSFGAVHPGHCEHRAAHYGGRAGQPPARPGPVRSPQVSGAAAGQPADAAAALPGGRRRTGRDQGPPVKGTATRPSIVHNPRSAGRPGSHPPLFGPMPLRGQPGRPGLRPARPASLLTPASYFAPVRATISLTHMSHSGAEFAGQFRQMMASAQSSPPPAPVCMAWTRFAAPARKPETTSRSASPSSRSVP
jgi:hypothetical protein